MKKYLILLTSTLLLTACGKSYNVEVDLTPEQTAEYEAIVQEYNDKITNFKPADELTTSTENVPTPEGGVLEVDVVSGDKPPSAWFVEKARAEEKLGRVDDAIKTLKSVFDYYQNSSVTSHNLAKLYHNAGNCKVAEQHYTTLLEDFQLPQYHRDIADCYMKKEQNLDKVKEHYYKYIEIYPAGEDSEFQTFINEESAKLSPNYDAS